MRVRRTVALLAAGSILTMTGCSDDGGSVNNDKTPDDVLALAKKTLDETSRVRITLEADELPDGVSAISAASGVGTHAPAFEGTLTALFAGQPIDVPVIAVDGVVNVQLPLAPGWQDVDPADYGAPDPAQLLSTENGLSSLLPATDGAEEGESVRGGENNEEVLTEFTGTVPGEVVSNVIPSAAGDFDATYTISAEGELRTAELTGVFYPDTEPMTYTLGLDDYGIEPDISAP